MTEPLWSYRILVEPGLRGEGLPVFDVPAGTRAAQAAEMLAEIFTVEPELSGIVLVVASEIVGVAGRDRVLALGGGAREIGAGDGASLPGRSRRYVVLRFRCERCGAEARQLFGDTVPTCPEGHGEMSRG